MSQQITINYKSSVFTPAGWRGVTITATAEKTSEKMAIVTEVTNIDGEDVVANMSRTGAKRQAYYGIGVASREIGAKKRLGTCTIIG
jgi:hypothetical protein